MKIIVGFLAIVFSVLIFAPSNTRMPVEDINVPDFDRVETYHYVPSYEVLQSKWELEECKRKIEANLTYLNSTDESNTQ